MTQGTGFMRRGRRALAALLVPWLAGCGLGGGYERAAEEVARSVGATDLVVHDSVSNFARAQGRTVRFAVAGDPYAVVPLSFSSPGRCENGADCADELRRNLAYARGQSAFAARLAGAFAPCGFHSAYVLVLNNVGLERRHQFVRAMVSLDRLVAPGGEAAARAEVAACAGALARGVGSRGYALDDVADWAARPVEMTIYLDDLSQVPSPEPPLVLTWQDALRGADLGRALIVPARLADGRAEVGEPYLEDELG